MPGTTDSGLLVVPLPRRSASERVREGLSQLRPEPELPSTPSGIYSLVNLSNLSRAGPTLDSAVAFLRGRRPVREDPRPPQRPRRVRPPTDLLPPVRRVRPGPMLLGLLLGLAGGALLFGLLAGVVLLG